MTRWRTTWIVFGLALVVFAFIALFERHWRRGDAEYQPPARLFTFKAADVTNIALHVTNQLLLRVERTNASSPWALTVPINYPAQSFAIEWVLAQLESLAPETRISQGELIAGKRTLAEYGLDLPAATLTLHYQGQRKEMYFGIKTPVGDQVYAQVLHDPGVFTAPAALFDRLPRAANDWRDTMLINLVGASFSRLEVRAPGRGFALEFDPASKILALTKPTPARADQGRVESLITRLGTAQVRQFISDNPRADLEAYGLQPPEAEFVAGLGTNDIIVVQFGKSPTNDPASVYARRLAQTNIVLVSRELLDFLQLPHSAFRDRHLMSFPTGAVESVEVIGSTNFTVRRQTNGTWMVNDGAEGPIDGDLMSDWLSAMNRLEGDIEADVVTDFKTLYGLNPPARQYIVRAALTNISGAASNRVVAELHLGAVQEEKVFARRPDEVAVYAVKPRDVTRLPHALWQLRDRRVFSFTTNQVTRISARYQSREWTLQRSQASQWSIGPGSQGVIRDPQMFSLRLEEIALRLGELRAEAWTARGEDFRLVYGFKDDSDRLVIELKNGDKPQTLTLEFGNRAPNQVPYALAVIDGQTRIFEMPAALFFYIVRDLFTPLAAAGK